MADTEYAATDEEGGAFAEKMSSASLTMVSKVSLLNCMLAIPARTFPGSWRFQIARIISGQQRQERLGLHLDRSFTKALASWLGFPTRTRLNARSIASSGRGPKILRISCLSNLYPLLLVNSAS